MGLFFLAVLIGVIYLTQGDLLISELVLIFAFLTFCLTLTVIISISYRESETAQKSVDIIGEIGKRMVNLRNGENNND